MNPKFFTPRRRGVAMFAACLIAVSGLGWAASALKNDGKSAVTIKVDEKPVSSANSPLGPSYAPIVKRVAPSVVRVEVSEKSKTVAVDGQMSPFANNPGFREFFGDQFGQQQGRGSKRRGQLLQQQPAQEGLGSGVIVSADGYILTNNHVVQGADTIKVALNDGRELTAKVVGTDPQSDLAVIKVDAKGLPAITFADSEKVEVGDRVLAVGNPFGIGQTVTSGMVSGLGRATMGLDYEDFIQTDAAINPGNSGGALVDGEGRLVGINTAILSRSGGSQGIGFAIPGNLARNVMEQLATNGKVVRGFVGVSVQDINPELAEQFKLTAREGALIAEVTPDGPAAKAGIKGGDVITSFGGKTVKDGRHLKLAVANVAPGSKVEAEVIRDGKTVKMDISVTERPGEKSLARNGGRNRGGQSADDEDTGTLNGVGVADIDPQSRREFDMPDRLRGALVTSVEPESPAAAAGLQPGDVILEINRKAVKGADDAIKLTEKTESKKTLLRVWNQRGSRFVVVDETKAPGASSEE
jgi:serine protease Do